jgi:hypothetical protein
MLLKQLSEAKMKLFTELNEEVSFITEMEESGKKAFYIEGIFLQGNIKNRNGRIYPVPVLEKEVYRYIDNNVKTSRAYGELGHPDGPNINLERVSHMIKNLRKEGDNFIGKAKILETPYGMIVRNLLAEGAGIGVSSRGMGSLRENREGIMEVQDDFHLATAADIVADPSAPNAYVRGIMEGAEWVLDSVSGSWRAQELVHEARKAGKILSEEQKLKLFNKVLSNLINK